MLEAGADIHTGEGVDVGNVAMHGGTQREEVGLVIGEVPPRREGGNVEEGDIPLFFSVSLGEVPPCLREGASEAGEAQLEEGSKLCVGGTEPEVDGVGGSAGVENVSADFREGGQTNIKNARYRGREGRSRLGRLSRRGRLLRRRGRLGRWGWRRRNGERIRL